MFRACGFTSIAILIAVLISGQPFAANRKPPAEQKFDFFNRKIHPVLKQHCYKCHSATSKDVQGGLFLDTRDGLRKGGESGPAIVPGNVEKSLLIDALEHTTLKMPPDKKLPRNVIADFRRWIKNGAADPRDGKPRKSSRR